MRRPSISVMLDGFDSFPEDLPDDICKVVRKNGPKYDSYYFDEFYRKLKKSLMTAGNCSQTGFP